MMAAAVCCALLAVAPGETAQAASHYRYRLYIKQGPLVLRTSASTTSSSKGTIPQKKTVTASKKVRGKDKKVWYRVTYRKKTGYISASCVTLKWTDVVYRGASQKTIQVNTDALVMRTSPSAKKAKAGILKKGECRTAIGSYQAENGLLWYRISNAGKTRYIAAKYTRVVKKKTSSSGSSADFETQLTQQGFPSSYKTALRTLHKKHPNWVFRAQKTNLNWGNVLKKEQRGGNNLVPKSSKARYKKKTWPYYNKLTGYKTYDGSWNQASDQTVAYYLDSRNGLTESGIYQFMEHHFHATSQNRKTIRALTSVSGNCTWDTASYAKWLYQGGKSAGVNPNVLTAMLIQEQGWVGTSALVTGKYKGYQGYYNHFNVGAYETLLMNKVKRGMWWAKGEGKGKTTYGRPWNSRYKSIRGGALFYAECYVKNRQNTYYTKKFNVMNGLNRVASHEYMTNVFGAMEEGSLLRYAYRNSADGAAVFSIPVYQNMPKQACPAP